MRLYIYALLYHLCYICLSSYHYINHWFIHLLCIFCMMNVVRMWQGNIVLGNIICINEGVHKVGLHRSWEKSCCFLNKEYKNGIFHLVLAHFNFWLVIECYCVSTSTSCQSNLYGIIQRKICSIKLGSH